MAKRMTGIILAGGENTRFKGILKPNIVIAGRTIISRMVETMKDVFDDIIIVTGRREEFTVYNNYKITGDQFIKKGPLGGIHAALKASAREAVFVFAGDMPLLSKTLIIKQINLYSEHKSDIFIPRVNENIEPLHGIYNQSVKPVLESYLEGRADYAVRDFYKQVNVNYMVLEDSEETKHAFMNINYPSDIPVVEQIIKLYHY